MTISTHKRVRRNWTLAQRVAHYSRPDASGCVLWTGHKTASGYGVISWGGKNRRAHRMAWEVANGPIPGGLHVCHRCDVPLCVSVEHLFLGTTQENTADRDAKGRQAKGDTVRMNNKQTKLTPEQVRQIRATKKRKHGVAAKFGISRAQIGRIRRGECWGDV